MFKLFVSLGCVAAILVAMSVVAHPVQHNYGRPHIDHPGVKRRQFDDESSFFIPRPTPNIPSGAPPGADGTGTRGPAGTTPRVPPPRTASRTTNVSEPPPRPTVSPPRPPPDQEEPPGDDGEDFTTITIIFPPTDTEEPTSEPTPDPDPVTEFPNDPNNAISVPPEDQISFDPTPSSQVTPPPTTSSSSTPTPTSTTVVDKRPGGGGNRSGGDSNPSGGSNSSDGSKEQPENPGSQGNGRPNVGAIVGSIVGVTFLGCFAIWWMRKYRQLKAIDDAALDYAFRGVPMGRQMGENSTSYRSATLNRAGTISSFGGHEEVPPDWEQFGDNNDNNNQSENFIVPNQGPQIIVTTAPEERLR